jgi:hypothetical protein
METNNKANKMLFDLFERKKLKRSMAILIVCCSIILASICVVIDVMVQYKFYVEVVNSIKTNSTQELIESYQGVFDTCSVLYYFNVPIIELGLAILLMIFYVILFKRRSFLMKKFKNRHFGLPAIIRYFLHYLERAVNLYSRSLNFFMLS